MTYQLSNFYNVRTVTESTTTVSSDYLIVVSGSNVTVELDTTGAFRGQVVRIKNEGYSDVVVSGHKDNFSVPSWSESYKTAQTWYSVAYGDSGNVGKFVTVGYSSNSGAYSTDGVIWTGSTLPGNRQWESVAYGAPASFGSIGRYVAVSQGTNSGAYSYDGITWTGTTFTGAIRNWQSVTYGSTGGVGKFVTVAWLTNSGAYSTDGITWTQTTLPSSQQWMGLANGGGKYVAVSEGPSNVGIYSTDGITWTSCTLPASRNWEAVSYGSGKFVTLGYGSNSGAYSTDGITWTATTLPYSVNWRGAGYGNGKFVAVANNSNLAAYSIDGVTWTGFSFSYSRGWTSVAYGKGTYVVTTPTHVGAYLKADNVVLSNESRSFIYDGSVWRNTEAV